MTSPDPQSASTAERFELRLVESEAELQACQHLRYKVFLTELGGTSAFADHDMELEMDRFDPFCDHLLLLDTTRPGSLQKQAVGTYRMMRAETAAHAGGFYTETEYDLHALRRSGRRLLELGRSCLDADHRGGAAMFHLWQGVADYVSLHGIELMFGVASFSGCDLAQLAQPLSYLHHNHSAPMALRAFTRQEPPQTMNLMPNDQIDRKAALLATPSLIKAYLRLGGMVGEGAYLDHAFNTTDVFLVTDTAKITPRQRDIYTRTSA